MVIIPSSSQTGGVVHCPAIQLRPSPHGLPQLPQLESELSRSTHSWEGPVKVFWIVHAFGALEGQVEVVVAERGGLAFGVF